MSLLRPAETLTMLKKRTVLTTAPMKMALDSRMTPSLRIPIPDMNLKAIP
jgi:hypothetical protein